MQVIKRIIFYALFTILIFLGIVKHVFPLILLGTYVILCFFVFCWFLMPQMADVKKLRFFRLDYRHNYFKLFQLIIVSYGVIGSIFWVKLDYPIDAIVEIFLSLKIILALMLEFSLILILFSNAPFPLD